MVVCNVQWSLLYQLTQEDLTGKLKYVCNKDGKIKYKHELTLQFESTRTNMQNELLHNNDTSLSLSQH